MCHLAGILPLQDSSTMPHTCNSSVGKAIKGSPYTVTFYYTRCYGRCVAVGVPHANMHECSVLSRGPTQCSMAQAQHTAPWPGQAQCGIAVEDLHPSRTKWADEKAECKSSELLYLPEYTLASVYAQLDNVFAVLYLIRSI